MIEANAYSPQMILIGLLYFSVDKGVFKNSKKNLIKMFHDSLFYDINVEHSEFMPRHILFHVRSPLVGIVYRSIYLKNF